MQNGLEIRLFKTLPDTDIMRPLMGVSADGTMEVLYYMGVSADGKLLDKRALKDYKTDIDSLFTLAEHSGYKKLQVSLKNVSRKIDVRQVWTVGKCPEAFLAYSYWKNKICRFFGVDAVRFVILKVDGEDVIFVMPANYRERFKGIVGEIFYESDF